MKYLYLLLLLLLIVSVIFNVYFVNQLLSKSTTSVIPVSLQYSLLSPRAQTQQINEIILNFTPLRSILREYVNSKTFPIHLYFEYLPSGASIGINDSIDSPTASLIKIPTIMAIFKKIERNELFLGKMLTTTEKHIDKSYGDFWKNGAGTTITLREAIEKTIIESDNTTHNLLYNLLSVDERKEVFEQLDIQLESNSEGDYFYVTPKSYTSVLKSLYFSTFLKKENSQLILELMTKIQDNTKIPAGLPEPIPIAHKIGVNESKQGDFYYNDCGIIYLPKRPYSLCIMIQTEETQAIEAMKEISSFIYKFMTSKTTGF